MVDSIHVARWIAQFDPTEVKFILFPSGPNRRVHPKILQMIENGKSLGNQITIVPFGGKLSLPLWALDRFFGDRIRGLLLRRILNKVSPDFVHALEFQHAGYITIRALKDYKIKTQFIATNYGSDIFWFQKFPRHRAKIKLILKRANFYSCECERDVALARHYGFNGTVLPVIPNSGGIAFDSLPNPLPFEQRRVIAVKGYDGWVGRARWVLLALEGLKSEIENFEIAVFSADRKTMKLARIIERRSGLKFSLHKKGSLSHDQMMLLFASARLYIGASLSDGLSTSMLEAISNRCFAVQSTTACTDGVLSDGVNGLVIRDLTPQGVSEIVGKAISIIRSGGSAVEFFGMSRGSTARLSSIEVSRVAINHFYV